LGIIQIIEGKISHRKGRKSPSKRVAKESTTGGKPKNSHVDNSGKRRQRSYYLASRSLMSWGKKGDNEGKS